MYLRNVAHVRFGLPAEQEKWQFNGVMENFSFVQVIVSGQLLYYAGDCLLPMCAFLFVYNRKQLLIQ